MIWIVLGLELLSGISSYLEYRLLQNVANEIDVSDTAIFVNDLREQVIGIASLVGYIISVVLFIMWFRRAYNNLHQVAGDLSYAEGWAAGAWFVPFINLYRPYQIMNELYLRSVDYLKEDESEPGETVSTRWVGWWWGLWILSNIVGQIVFRYTLRADSLDELMTANYLGIASNLIQIPLAIAAVKVIKDYSAIEAAMSEKVKTKSLIPTEPALDPGLPEEIEPQPE